MNLDNRHFVSKVTKIVLQNYVTLNKNLPSLWKVKFEICLQALSFKNANTFVALLSLNSRYSGAV